MRTNGGAARLDDGGGVPAACDDGEGATEVLLHRANPAAATDSDDGDASGGAARLESRRRLRRLELRGDGATSNGGTRDLGQTEEDD
uniref:DUF834 domain-containing protein n=1 Tax=Oryza sativa subsp. japonica TaxID=39947 RepID=Q6YTM2_ORYSJ|nr:hypothetical protein [Oryza sativa Japonica Group]